MEKLINLITLLYSLNQAESTVLYEYIVCSLSVKDIIKMHPEIPSCKIQEICEDLPKKVFTQYGFNIRHIRTEMDAQYILQFLIKFPIRPSVQKMTQYLQLYPFTEALDIMSEDDDVEVRKRVAACPCIDTYLCYDILEYEIDEEVRDMARLNLEYR